MRNLPSRSKLRRRCACMNTVHRNRLKRTKSRFMHQSCGAGFDGGGTDQNLSLWLSSLSLRNIGPDPASRSIVQYPSSSRERSAYHAALEQPCNPCRRDPRERHTPLHICSIKPSLRAEGNLQCVVAPCSACPSNPVLGAAETCSTGNS